MTVSSVSRPRRRDVEVIGTGRDGGASEPDRDGSQSKSVRSWRCDVVSALVTPAASYRALC